MVVYSSHLDGRTLRGLEKRLEKQETALQGAVKEITKLTFSCEDDAKDALARFLKKHDQAFFPLDSAVVKSTEKLKRKRLFDQHAAPALLPGDAPIIFLADSNLVPAILLAMRYKTVSTFQKNIHIV